ncbi:MAG: triose-phosphate isomerase [Asticcacaulis sp.]
MPHPCLIAANWKMHGLRASLTVAQTLASQSHAHPARVVIFPPATLLPLMAENLKGSALKLGGQDCSPEDSGAYTGDISAAMLKDAGADLVILGHSERRHGHKETCELVAQKVRAALRAGLEPIICIGETLAQRQAEQTTEVLLRQLTDSLPPELAGKAFHVAYEPRWAIGTGLLPSDAQISEAISLIHQQLQHRFPGTQSQILYGGSVKGENAGHLLSLPGIGGLLVGGASLTAEGFLPIIAAAGPRAPLA